MVRLKENSWAWLLSRVKGVSMAEDAMLEVVSTADEDVANGVSTATEAVVEGAFLDPPKLEDVV